MRAAALFLLLAGLLAGCGYHLRQTASIPPEYRRMAVEITGENDLRPVLISTLLANGIDVQEKREQASALLQISENRIRRVVQSVGANNRVQEFRLEYDLTFLVLDARSGETIIPEQKMHLERDYAFDITQITAARQEEDLLREKLLEDMAWQIIRRMEAQFRVRLKSQPESNPEKAASPPSAQAEESGAAGF